MNTSLIGAGGGKSGAGGGGISEDPDTLSSVAVARFVDLIGEGPIVGLVNNEHSIYLDGVPLKSLSGTPNYKPFLWDDRLGTQSQTPIPGFSGTQSEEAVGLAILEVQGMVIRSISDAECDSVRVTVAVSALSETSSKGKIRGAEVAYKIFVRTAAGSWKTGFNGSIKGKTTSRYQRSHEIELRNLGPGPYEVAVQRITEDASSSLITDDLFWDSYTVINYEQFAYPNSALIAVQIDARYFSQVPSRSYHVRGLLVQVPRNYNPVTRAYATSGVGTTSGAWDGTFKIAWTDNPAWCYYDIVTSKRYGLGKRIAPHQISKWALYAIAKYCDGLVPTGNTSNVFDALTTKGVSPKGKPYAPISYTKQNMEPRFTLNCVINTPEDAYKILGQLASVFRSMPYWSNSSVTLTQDRPTEESMIWTNANVEDSVFNYEGSARSQRNTVALVAWNDPSEDFVRKWEYIEDRDGIARYGIKTVEVVAFGTTSRTQARRFGLWLLYTQRMEREAITFITGLDSSMVEPGEVGKILDVDRVGADWGGRVISSTITSLTLDAPVTLEEGSYTLSVMAQDGTVVERTVNIATFGEYTTLNVSVAFAVAPAAMAIWTLASSVVVPMLVRVVARAEEEKNKFKFTCLEHNPSKYAAIETGVGIEEFNYSFLSFDDVAPVKNLVLTEDSFKRTVKSPTETNLEISWDPVVDPMIRGYIVKVSGSDKSVITLPEMREPACTLTGALAITYTVTVSAINVLGIVGPTLSTSKTLTGLDTAPPADVLQIAFTYILDPNIGVRLIWEEVEDYIDFYEIRKGTVWASASLVDQVKASTLILGPLDAAETTYLIKAVDTSGNYSENAATVLVKPNVPGQLVLSYAIAGTDEIISWDIPPSSFTVDRYELRYGTTWEEALYLDTTKSTSYRRKVDYGGPRRYWATAIDVAGNPGVPDFIDVIIEVPGEVTSPRSEVIDNNALIFWDVPARGALPVDRYEVRKGESFADGFVVGSNGNSTFAAVFEQQSGTYTYWVAAYDSAGNVGTPVGILASVSQPPDYVLRTDIDSDLPGTLTNLYFENSKLVGPVDTTEDWATHFSSRGYATPQDQIDAGFPIYAMPSVTSGSYEELFDYGTVLPATTIAATLGYQVLAGVVGVSCQIAYKALPGDPWINAATGATSVLASGFQYVKVTYTFTCTAGANLISVHSLNVKLSSKLRTDSGTATITDAALGVLVNFGVDFIDADTPIIQPHGAVPLIPVVSFLDAPDPTSFTGYLYNTSGVKVTGSFSWTVRGF